MQWTNKKGPLPSKLDEMRARTPREILGVADTASIVEIKTRYRELVKTYHPDSVDPFMRSYSEEALKIINDAYARLTRE
ncbi:hypothetical protein FRZ61_18650 [Hypericibacter adhaerens]|jgi:curved DNA-binding protein CbpA|uniref:J domain-containing protein n=1 Tax=Hypericibacter adhaerens TaxID=2602016 RepID=A0A5J6N4V4_9PROT|nr:J domain-containing protein [Hypericibacter adhaerens]QEX21936.1 hypothetical protein FRZ61_18650 [Hypericibacter adhaerens]